MNNTDLTHNAPKMGLHQKHTGHYWIGHKSGNYYFCSTKGCNAKKNKKTGRIYYET